MERLSQSRLASALTIAVGAWLMLSPIFISTTGAALVSLLIVGAVMIVFGFAQLGTDNTSPSWINAAASLWLLVSTLFLGMSGAVITNQVIFAIIGFILATWDGAEMGEVHRLRHSGTMHGAM
ncbi:MAG: hypothetical protein WDN27_05455 [Candidatus Saccharibacteria bacterium]